MTTYKLLLCTLLIATSLPITARKKNASQQQEAPTIPYLHYAQDRFGNLNIDVIPNDADTPALLVQLKKFIKTHKNKYKNKAFLLNIPHELGAYNQAAKQAGFKMQYADDDKTQWVYHNGSTIPYSSPAIGTAKIFIIRTDNGQQELLLVKDNDKSYLSLPGGAVDVNEHVLDAAVREIKEELDLTLKRDAFTLLALSDNAKTDFYSKNQYAFFFRADYPGGTIKLDPKEQEHYFWIPIDHLLKVNTIQGYQVDGRIKKILELMKCNQAGPLHVSLPKSTVTFGASTSHEMIDLWRV